WWWTRCSASGASCRRSTATAGRRPWCAAIATSLAPTSEDTRAGRCSTCSGWWSRRRSCRPPRTDATAYRHSCSNRLRAMANTSHKTDSKRLGPGATSSSTFMLLTVLTGVVLVAAAAALWLGRTDEGRDPPVELALLSPAVTRHAVAGVAGDEEAFERLRTALARIAELKGAAPAAALPGGPAAWSRIEQHAGALLAHREAGATLNDAAAWMEQHVPATLAAMDAWLEVSGATGPIQAFRERGRALVDGVAALAAGDAAPDLAGRLRDDLAWMQDLANGLKGGETTLDVAALPPESAVLLDPVIAELGEIGTRLEGAPEAAGDLRDPQAELAGLAAGADAVLRAARAGGDAPARALPGILGEPRLPLVLVGLAVLLLAVLA